MHKIFTDKVESILYPLRYNTIHHSPYIMAIYNFHENFVFCSTFFTLSLISILNHSGFIQTINYAGVLRAMKIYLSKHRINENELFQGTKCLQT